MRLRNASWCRAPGSFASASSRLYVRHGVCGALPRLRPELPVVLY
jgi:hypothetical protein